MRFEAKIYTEDSGVFYQEQEEEFGVNVTLLYKNGAVVSVGGKIVWFPPSQIRRIEVTEKK